MSTKRKIQKGIYLVVDPQMERRVLVEKVKAALKSGICALQVWDNIKSGTAIIPLLQELSREAHNFNVPVFINNHWQLLKETDLDGVHFDEIPEDLASIKREINRDMLIGLTCGNDPSKIEWAEASALDYISFCSIFPSNTSNSCESVSFDTIKNTLERYRIPVFLAGGITPENLGKLNRFAYSGVAVVSGIMDAVDPGTEITRYKTQSNFEKNETGNHQ